MQIYNLKKKGICTSDILCIALTFEITSLFSKIVFQKFQMCFRLFYAGAVEGQMPEILSMIQVNKMTPAPAVLVVVIKIQIGKEN